MNIFESKFNHFREKILEKLSPLEIEDWMEEGKLHIYFEIFLQELMGEVYYYFQKPEQIHLQSMMVCKFKDSLPKVKITENSKVEDIFDFVCN